MALWFSATAVVPELRREWGISEADASWLTTAVQLGFVAGALISAGLNLPDVVSVRRLIVASALAGAAANAGLTMVDGLAAALPLRFITGMALAGVYPSGIKLMASWFRVGRGLAIGALVGALVLGSGAPHLVNALPAVDWRAVIWASTAMALAGAAVAAFAVREGPEATAAAGFDPGYVLRMFAERRQRLVSFGYFGHMWELYAVYAWMPAYAAASFAAWYGSQPSRAAVEVTAFAAIGVAGLVGCVVAGALADRFGRPEVTVAAMTVSGSCCLLAAAAFGLHPAVLVALLLVWGIAVVADSAQFSAALTEVADPRYVGTALTAQTAIGFLITVVSIRLLPEVVSLVGWRYAFIVLAAGPALGVVAMRRFRTAMLG